MNIKDLMFPFQNVKTADIIISNIWIYNQFTIIILRVKYVNWVLGIFLGEGEINNKEIFIEI